MRSLRFSRKQIRDLVRWYRLAEVTEPFWPILIVIATFLFICGLIGRLNGN